MLAFRVHIRPLNQHTTTTGFRFYLIPLVSHPPVLDSVTRLHPGYQSSVNKGNSFSVSHESYHIG